MDIRESKKIFTLVFGLGLLMALCFASPSALAQSQTTVTGTVISSSRDTLKVRTSTGEVLLFVYDRGATKPTALKVGSRVRVTSSAGYDPAVRTASEVSTIESGTTNQETSSEPPVPEEVNRVEHDIQREVRRFQGGVRAGVALDPELIMIGVQAQVGPFFSPNVFFRPSVEFGWGEVSALFSLNPEVIYQLPLASRGGRWSTYFGVGPGFNFVHQSFQSVPSSGKRIDFGDFHGDVALNILGGMRYRSGLFTELRTSVYSDPSPTLRLIVGYTF